MPNSYQHQKLFAVSPGTNAQQSISEHPIKWKCWTCVLLVNCIDQRLYLALRGNKQLSQVISLKKFSVTVQGQITCIFHPGG